MQNSVLQSDSKGDINYVLGVYIDISQPYIKPQISLIKRELEIVKLMAEGYSSKLNVDKLFISFHAVNTHQQRINEKVNSKNTGGVVHFAVSHGLI